MRRILSCLLAVLLLTALVHASAAGTVTVTIDGVPVSYDRSSGVPFIDENNRTQVPLRRTMEFFGCDVSWNPLTRTATVKKDKTKVSVPIGKNYIQVGKERVPTDTAALIKEGRTYLPIRAVAEAFGATVTWDAETQTVVILTGENSVRVHFIDVCQGDATLIDCGPKDAGSLVVNYLKPYVDGKLDLLIATHPDADHIGGLAAVLSAYDVGEVIDSGYPGTSWAYRNYWEAAQAERGCLVSYDSDRTISLGENASLAIIETGDDWDNANDSSVVCRLDCGSVRILFTGDMSRGVEQARLRLFGDVTVLKAGHHGSASSTCQEFLNVVRPEYAVISYGKNNDYHHPAPSALRRLLNCGATVYGTGKSGTVVLSTDGKRCYFNTSDALTMADAG